MSQIRPLVETLKRALKARGLTYSDVANALGVSEISVKRMFSARIGAITLERFEAICRLVELDLTDLVSAHERAKQRLSRLTLAQEKELVADLRLLLVAVLVRNGWTYADILRAYAFTEPECIQRLARLDRLGLIELLPGNRVRSRVARDFRWLPKGPIERFFEQNVQGEFLRGPFDGDDELRLYLSASLSARSIERLRASLQRTTADFTEAQLADSTLPLEERRNVGLLLAMRPWNLSAFEALRRPA